MQTAERPRTNRFYTRLAMRHRIDVLEAQADAAFAAGEFDQADKLAAEAHGYRMRLDKWDV